MMKPASILIAGRPAANLVPTTAATRSFLFTRPYATQHSLGTTPTGPRRRTVTPFNDDGFVPWNELSSSEKAARATQQSFNFGMIIVGIVLSVRIMSRMREMYYADSTQSGVAYFLWTDVFSPDSKVSQFNRAVDKIKRDARCLELFGESKKITAHGDETFNKWRRARPISSVDHAVPVFWMALLTDIQLVCIH